MSRGDSKFDPIQGLDLSLDEKEESIDNKDIEQGSLILKLKGQEPLVFDILTRNPNIQKFLLEFFMEFGETIYKSLKEQKNERTQDTKD